MECIIGISSICCGLVIPGFAEFTAGDLVNDYMECRSVQLFRASRSFPDLRTWVYAGPCAKWGLNYVIDEYLPNKLRNTGAFLP